MRARDRNPPETPEGAAWELFMEIREAEEKEDSRRRNKRPVRTEMLELYVECLMAARGERRDVGATVH